jgi:hypothetical protein
MIPVKLDFFRGAVVEIRYDIVFLVLWKSGRLWGDRR